MATPDPDHSIDRTPTADDITQYRQEAAERSGSVVAAYPGPEGRQQFLVVSARGTCVVLDQRVSRETFNASVDADDIASALAADDA
jgi:hypothetical protein